MHQFFDTQPSLWSMVQLSHLHMTTGKNHNLTISIFVGKMLFFSLFFFLSSFLFLPISFSLFFSSSIIFYNMFHSQGNGAFFFFFSSSLQLQVRFPKFGMNVWVEFPRIMFPIQWWSLCQPNGVGDLLKKKKTLENQVAL